jgi:tetratricopeptide (TPR) repeat protein
MGLIVLRSTVIETPLVDQAQTRWMLSSENVTLFVSTVLLACMGVWLLVSIFRGQFCWRKTGFGMAVGVFIMAGLLSAWFASNKRAAITDLVTLAAPMLSGLLLVQLLTSAGKIRLALLLVLAVGVAATIQCIDQQTDTNETLIAEYQANPTEFLEKQGIEPDTMEHFMYEHRLYSKDIRGFLMTSNSAATFFLMAAFAGLGLCLQIVQKKMPREMMAVGVCYLLALFFALAGLFLTQSKGGLGAFVLGLLLLVFLLSFGKAIWKRRWLFCIAFLLLILLAGGVVIHYGVQHGRLPGGNSMLVRWQYWVSTVEMIRGHLLAGVGGGNFPEFYTHYKIPAALETVQNPHNWVLSLLSQYGVLGLAAFVAAVLVMFYKSLNHSLVREAELQKVPQEPAGRLWIGVLAFSAAMLLLVRPVLVDLEFFYQKPDVAAAAYLFLYFIPAMVFVLAFILLRKASVQDAAEGGKSHYLSIALVCGLVAVLIHNLIDFAIFEPGNWSVFWLFAAILMAQIDNAKSETAKTNPLDPPKRMGLFAGLLILSIAYLAVVLLPPLRAEWLFRRAVAAQTQGFELTDKAIAADALSAKTPFQAANMLTQVYQSRGMSDQAFLDRARGFVDIAIERNPADFKPWRLRAKINVIRSEQTEGQAKEAALQKAFEDLQQAVARYPGSGNLHSLLANVAEQLGRETIALCHYQTAVSIEDAYRAQFRIMYPDRDTVISRLGEIAYQEAKAKIKELSGKRG